jgi:hypothetical protein
MNSKDLGKSLGVVTLVALCTMALAAPLAQAATPAPEFTRFAGCPDPKTENPQVEACLRALISGGNIKFGSQNAPITSPITLTGGTNLEFKDFSFNSKGGMRPVKQQVPADVLGLTGLTRLVGNLNPDQRKLYAVTELTAPPEVFGEIVLSLKIHLINPMLGNNCYVGTNSAPIVMHLTTKTTNPPPPNRPISGKEPEFSYDSPTEVISLKGGKYVDNSFSAPGASGCTLKLLGFPPVSIDNAVDKASGLPSAPGRNEAFFNIDTEVAEPTRVYP